MQTVRTAVIGVGYLGRFHAQKYATLPQSRLVAVVDADPAARDRVAAEVGCRAVADFREILGEVDAVSIATPTPAHYAIARECLERGVHVLVEKPVTETLDEARSLIEVAARTGRILQVGHLERFNPAIRALEGTLGTPRFVESHRLAPFKERGTDVNVVLDLMIHDIDLIQSLVRAPITSIDAVGTSVFSAGLDIANARIRYANGCVANTTASRISMKMERKLRHLPGRRLRLDRPAAEGAHRRAQAAGGFGRGARAGVHRGAHLRAGRRAQARDRGVPRVDTRGSPAGRVRRGRPAGARDRAQDHRTRAGRGEITVNASTTPGATSVAPSTSRTCGAWPAAASRTSASSTSRAAPRTRRPCGATATCSSGSPGCRGRWSAPARRTSAPRSSGDPVNMPIIVAPTGFNGLLWPQGDIALARAAAAAGIPFTLSTASNCAVGRLAATVPGQPLVPALRLQGPERRRSPHRPGGRSRLRGAGGHGRCAGPRRARVGPAQLPCADEAQHAQHARRAAPPPLADADHAAVRRADFENLAEFLPPGKYSALIGAKYSFSQINSRLSWHDVERIRKRWPGQARREGTAVRRGRAPFGRGRRRRHRAFESRRAAAGWRGLRRGTAAGGRRGGRGAAHRDGGRRIPPWRRRAEGDRARRARGDDRARHAVRARGRRRGRRQLRRSACCGPRWSA